VARVGGSQQRRVVPVDPTYCPEPFLQSLRDAGDGDEVSITSGDDTNGSAIEFMSVPENVGGPSPTVVFYDDFPVASHMGD
jgi:hypothetical protein